MQFIDRMMMKWARFRKKHESTFLKIEDRANRFADKCLVAWDYMSKNKKLVLSAPIAVIAVILAIINLFSLPALVGIGMEGNGDYAFQMIREVAVIAPLLITAVCLLLMFASKRTLTPWMVSLFSLLLPIMILLTNTFPG